MREIEEKEVTRTRKVRRITKIECDICGRREDPGDFSNRVNWGAQHGNATTVVVGMKTGSSGRGGGAGEYRLLGDICPDCFVDEVAPLLEEEFGLELRVEKWDW